MEPGRAAPCAGCDSWYIPRGPGRSGHCPGEAADHRRGPGGKKDALLTARCPGGRRLSGAGGLRQGKAVQGVAGRAAGAGQAGDREKGLCAGEDFRHLARASKNARGGHGRGWQDKGSFPPDRFLGLFKVLLNPGSALGGCADNGLQARSWSWPWAKRPQEPRRSGP